MENCQFNVSRIEIRRDSSRVNLFDFSCVAIVKGNAFVLRAIWTLILSEFVENCCCCSICTWVSHRNIYAIVRNIFKCRYHTVIIRDCWFWNKCKNMFRNRIFEITEKSSFNSRHFVAHSLVDILYWYVKVLKNEMKGLYSIECHIQWAQIKNWLRVTNDSINHSTNYYF